MNSGKQWNKATPMNGKVFIKKGQDSKPHCNSHKLVDHLGMETEFLKIAIIGSSGSKKHIILVEIICRAYVISKISFSHQHKYHHHYWF